MKLIAKLRQNEENVYTICNVLFNLLNINVTEGSLKEAINKHTYFPSLLTVKDVLEKFGVKSAALNRNQHSFDDFECPFIVSLQKKEWGSSFFTILKNVDNDIVEYYDPVDLEWKKDNVENFGTWDKNIILLIEKQNQNGEPNYYQKRKVEKQGKLLNALPVYLFALISFSGILFNIIYQSSTQVIFSTLLLIYSLAGVFFSMLLSWYEVDKQNPFLKEVCSSRKNVNCGAVLSTNGAMIFGIEWSILGFCYFLAYLLSFLIMGIGNTTILMILSVFSILISPYIIYSLYYQYKIVKQWCILCIGVQAVLFLQLITALSYFTFTDNSINIVNTQYIIAVFLTFAFIFSIGIFVFPFIKKAKLGRIYELKWKRLKANPAVFMGLLSQQPKISKYPEHLGIVLGNINAQTEIIKVCNPYCGPCSKAHPVLEDIIKNNQDIKLRIIFTADDDDNDIKAAPVKHFMALSEIKTSEEMQTVMDDWYINDEIHKDYTLFSQKYPLNGQIAKQGEKLSAMNAWCNELKIRATPTFFINGHEIVDNYSIQDIKEIFTK